MQHDMRDKHRTARQPSKIFNASIWNSSGMCHVTSVPKCVRAQHDMRSITPESSPAWQQLIRVELEIVMAQMQHEMRHPEKGTRAG